MSSTFATTETVSNAVVAHLLCEKLAERESQVLQAELTAAAQVHGWRLAVDAAEVTMLPSVGLGTLVSLHKACRQGGGKMVVFGLATELVDLLKLSRLDRVLTIVGDRDAALKALA